MFPLDQREKIHQALSLCRFSQNLTDHGPTPCRTFDGKDLDIGESGVVNFGRQFLRAMKIRRREVGWVICRIAVLTGGEVRCNNFAKLCISKEAAREPID